MSTSTKFAKVLGVGLFAVGFGAPAAHAAQAGYRNLVLSHGATAYYQFEEAAGATTAVDSAGGDNNGTYLNVALGQGSATSALGFAGGFNGAGAVRIPDAATFDLGTGPVTVELWFQTPTTARGDLFTYKGGGGDFGIHSESQAPDTVSYYHSGFVGNPSPTPVGLWHHFAATRDGAGLVRNYVDGILTNSGTSSNTLNITNDILIGSNHNGDPSSLAIPFNGLIDEVAWYPTALTQAQLQSHIAASVPEPSTAAVVVVGAVVAAAGRRRRSAR